MEELTQSSMRMSARPQEVCLLCVGGVGGGVGEGMCVCETETDRQTETETQLQERVTEVLKVTKQ